MLLRSAIARLGQAAFIAACLTLPASAERIAVSPDDVDLQAVLDRAADGDVVVLRSGEHRGQLRIARRLKLEGEPGAVVLGPGKGNVITVSAPRPWSAASSCGAPDATSERWTRACSSRRRRRALSSRATG